MIFHALTILMRPLLILIAVLSAFFPAAAQQPVFRLNLSPADSLRHEGDLQGALTEYRKTYAANPGNGTNTYNFACALAIAGQHDSCYRYLDVILKTDKSAESILTDPDFIPIKEDPR